MNMMKPKRLEMDGIEYDATIFIGDGKLYDATYEEGMPIRRGSFLLRPVQEVIEEVPVLTEES